jgi:hypothetical protein
VRTWPSRVAGLLSLSVVFAAGIARADDASECIAAAEAAQPLRAAAKLRAARDKVLFCARPQCPRLVRADCTTWAEELEAALPTVVVLARDAEGRPVSSVRVSVDDEAIAEELMGKPIPVDPGRHVVRFEWGAGPTTERPIVVGAGEKNRMVSAELPPRQPRPAPAAALHPVPAVHDEARGPSPLAFVFGGVALAGLASATTFGLIASSDLDRLRDRCAPRCPVSELDDVRTKALVADVSLVVAGVSGALAVWLFLKREPPTSARSPSLARAWDRVLLDP